MKFLYIFISIIGCLRLYPIRNPKMKTYTFEIPALLYSRFNRKAKAIGKKAKKFGLTFNVSLKGESTEVVSIQGKSYPVDVKIVQVQGEDSVKLGDWQLVARASKEEAGHIVINLDGTSDRHIFDGSVCEHCHTNRRRNKVYLLRNVRSQDLIQVGSTCLKDFLGHQSAAQLAEAFSDLIYFLEKYVLREFMEPSDLWIGGGSGGGGGGGPLELLEYLALVGQEILENGWLSKSKAYNYEDSTSYQAFRLYESGLRVPPSDLVEEALDWAASLGGDTLAENDYLANLNVIAKSDFIRQKNMGFAASIIPAYQKYLKDEAKKVRKEKGQVSEWVGEIGDKILAEVTLVSAKRFVGESFGYHDSGERIIYNFLDSQGNVLTWFTSTTKLEEFVDQVFTIKGTVKKHDEFRGTKQTILNRVSKK